MRGESAQGVIFDIKQFAVFDGPGIRTTVFLKGCPLRCRWCHNPEGLSFEPQLMVSQNGCTKCKRCIMACEHPDNCILCGSCIPVCPNRLRKICGERMTAEALSQKLLKDKDYLNAQNGGVTFSGGEPTGQPDFLTECLKRLKSVNRAIETCGYCDAGVFETILEELDYVIMDIKLADRMLHKRCTGVDNRLILQNLQQVIQSGKPFRVRIPVIPGINDSEENYRQTAALLTGAKNLELVELLPYHKTAGAKYEMVGRPYRPEFDTNQEPWTDTKAFSQRGIECRSLK